MAYGRYGPFTDDEEPGMSAEFLNPLEDFLVSINSAATDSRLTSDGNGRLNLNTVGNSVTGQTSGTATLYQMSTGIIKEFVLVLSNYRNTASQTITLPTAFVAGGQGYVGNTVGNSYSFLLSGTAQNLRVLTTIGTSGGGANPATTVFLNSVFEVVAGFDTIRLNTSSGASNGFLILKGY